MKAERYVPEIIREAEVASNHVLQQTRRRLFGQLQNHLPLRIKWATLSHAVDGELQTVGGVSLTRIMATWEKRSYVWQM